MRIGCLLLLMLVGGGAIYGQSDNKKAAANYQRALELFRQKDYNGTHAALDKAAALDDRFPELYLLRADVLDKEKRIPEEIEAIRKAFELDSLKFTYYNYLLADCYYEQGDYENARKYFERYMQTDKKQNQLTAARRKTENCNFALHALRVQKKQPVQPYITSDKNVYWPSLDAMGHTILYTMQDGMDENIRMKMDTIDRPLNLNTTENEGTQSLTADGRMMYFTACGRKGGLGSCDIYVAYRISDTLWSEPINLGYPLNTEAWEAQPAISADGTKLYFASNREEGRGGSDIWYSTLLRREPDGRQLWSRPKCLYFNTSGQEMAPFLYYDSETLFFASDAYPGMGGMDIYKVNVNRVNTPDNIGITVNTQKDEMGFAVDITGKWGYFASDINGPKNIFKYYLDDSIACPAVSRMELVLQDETGYPPSPENLVVVDPETSDTLAYYDGVYMNSPILICATNDKPLLLSIAGKGHMYYSDTIRIGREGVEKPLQKNIRMQKIKIGESLVLKGMFFDVDDHHLKPQSVTELQQLLHFLNLNHTVTIEISGHTDNTGSEQHNVQLSDARAFEVYKYLFVNRINKNRMTYKGYGKTVPVAPNDSEQGRARNRRTEIKITKE